MGIKKVKDGKLLYHLTKLDNLESIIKDGLLPRNRLVAKRSSFSDVADEEIISKRTELGLDSYTPFHFHPYSSFDVAVKYKYPHDEFIYLCLQREVARNNGFKIIPKHPLSRNDCHILDYDEGFEAIDWVTMSEKGRDDDYAKQVKMAECITELEIPIENFIIYVENEYIKKKVKEALKAGRIKSEPPYINVRPEWFGGEKVEE